MRYDWILLDKSLSVLYDDRIHENQVMLAQNLPQIPLQKLSQQCRRLHHFRSRLSTLTFPVFLFTQNSRGKASSGFPLHGRASKPLDEKQDTEAIEVPKVKM